MRCLTVCLSTLGILALVGCGGSSSSEPTAEAPKTQTEVVSPAADRAPTIVRYANPVETVNQFLNALKAGDVPKVRAMLTVKAQEETAKHDLRIQPPGSATAEFSVSTEFRYVGDQKQVAHVLSTWHDLNEEGEQTEYEIAWVLRYENDGWGIAGFATKVFEDRMPLVLSFEKPLEMMQQREWAKQEMTRRAQQNLDAQQAQREETTEIR